MPGSLLAKVVIALELKMYKYNQMEINIQNINSTLNVSPKQHTLFNCIAPQPVQCPQIGVQLGSNLRPPVDPNISMVGSKQQVSNNFGTPSEPQRPDDAISNQSPVEAPIQAMSGIEIYRCPYLTPTTKQYFGVDAYQHPTERHQ